MKFAHLRNRFFLCCLMMLIAMSFALIALTLRPAWGAQLADPVRAVIGNQGVAELETMLFTVQDKVRQMKYRWGREEVAAPWAVTVLTPTPWPTLMPTATPTAQATDLPSPTPTATALAAMSLDSTPPPPPPPPTSTPLPPTPTPTATPWQPTAVTPLGDLAGEGVWSPYVYTPSGEVVAYRTFLQPDPERPFVVVGVVAFDLSQTRLHFVLGTTEPAVPGGPRGTGTIPEAHQAPGILLAAFNGGFKATHGQYGAMANGVTAIAPTEGLGTIAMYEDGTVRIGEWGTDILDMETLVAWRQNAHLVVKDGQITPLAQQNSVYHWSGTIENEVVTWRSGVGLNAEGTVLYYFAGPSLHMPALGDTMLAAGVAQGILLDINPSWVHFTAVVADENQKLIGDPLFPEHMSSSRDRFLRPYARDFFYVTSK